MPKVLFACDTATISKSNWSVVYVSSEELSGEGLYNGNAQHCIDEKPLTFWHSQWKDSTYDYPHEIIIDLGALHPINGFSFQTRNDTRNGRIKDFEFYTSTDNLNWNFPQAVGALSYPNPENDVQQTAYYYFGTVSARYVRLIGLNSISGDKFVMLAELNIYQDTVCGASGKNNQIITFPKISKQLSTATPISLQASSTSGLPIAYTIVSGPATVQGNTLTLNGTSGIVTIQASQNGNEQYYPAVKEITFDVIDLSEYSPQITTNHTNTVMMNQLHPYLLQANVTINEEEYLTIDSVVYTIGNKALVAKQKNNNFCTWWTPETYGNNTITILATASNGNTTEETIILNVQNQTSDMTAVAFDGGVIDFGSIGSQWYYGTYELPQFVGVFDSISADFSVSCPNVSGGCDDWDRLAWVEIKTPSGQWVELFRYITPYGVACNHSLDVTDYASLLQGKVEFRMFIETWGSGGWQLNLKLNYFAGTPTYLYSSVEELWKGTYDFGNPLNLQPMDTLTIVGVEGTEYAKIRLVTTGHGWGENNTGNAAEFYHAKHHLYIDNKETFEQDLWTKCDPNPDGCSPQYGTYKYNRAGWCPGAIARPYFYDITPYLAKIPFQLSYIFQTSYQDKCHPNNPNCITGITCKDCNDGYNPMYRIGGYIIRLGNNPLSLNIPEYPIVKTSEFNISVYPNPSAGTFRIQTTSECGQIGCRIIDISGRTLKTYFFADKAQLESHLFNITSLEKGVYFIQLYNKQTFTVKKIIFQ